MICSTCYGMLRGQDGRQWRGTFDLYFDHHVNLYEIGRSEDMGCCICRSLSYALNQMEIQHECRDPNHRERFVSAFLSEVQGKRDIYRLDFKLRDSINIGTFLLQQASKL